MDAEPITINLPPKTSLWKNLSAFASVCSQLVLENDQPIYERFRESDILERSAQLAPQVSIYTKYLGMKFQFKISNFLLFQSAAISSWAKRKSDESG